MDPWASRRCAIAIGLAAVIPLAGSMPSRAEQGDANLVDAISDAPHVLVRRIGIDGPPAGDRSADPVVFVLPDDVWDERRAWPYLDRLSLRGATTVEVFTDDDRHLTLQEARAAVSATVEALGLDPSRVGLLGFGSGGRLALALAGPDNSAVALYPICAGAAPPDPRARALVLHSDDAAEASACAALVHGRPAAHSSRAAAGAGHGWDVAGERSDGRTLLPDPNAPDDLARRLPARPDAWVTFRAARAVAGFLVGNSAARRPGG